MSGSEQSRTYLGAARNMHYASREFALRLTGAQLCASVIWARRAHLPKTRRASAISSGLTLGKTPMQSALSPSLQRSNVTRLMGNGLIGEPFTVGFTLSGTAPESLIAP